LFLFLNNPVQSIVLALQYNGCFFKSGVEVGVELSIVNALYRLRITDQLFKSYALHEWCDLNRLSNAYFDAKFKKTPFICRSNKKLQNFVIKLIRYPVGSFQTNNYSESNQYLHLRVRKQITLVQTKPKNCFPLCITAPMVQYLQT
jgi:hypothetical protein